MDRKLELFRLSINEGWTRNGSKLNCGIVRCGFCSNRQLTSVMIPQQVLRKLKQAKQGKEVSACGSAGTVSSDILPPLPIVLGLNTPVPHIAIRIKHI